MDPEMWLSSLMPAGFLWTFQTKEDVLREDKKGKDLREETVRK